MSIPAIILVLLSFVVTFTVARYLGRGFRKRRAEKAQAEARKNQSRQVRRAQDRSARR